MGLCAFLRRGHEGDALQAVFNAGLNGIRSLLKFTAVLERQSSQPLACLLLLVPTQDVHAVSVDYVTCGAKRLIAPAVLRAVMLADPGAAFGSLAVPGRQTFTERAPVRLPALLEALAPSCRVSRP